MEEYSKARDKVLAECGQDISRRWTTSIGRGTIGAAGWPHVYIYTGGNQPVLKIDVGPVAYKAAELAPDQHWSGSLRRWEAALSILIAANADTIMSAWAQQEEAAE